MNKKFDGKKDSKDDSEIFSPQSSNAASFVSKQRSFNSD